MVIRGCSTTYCAGLLHCTVVSGQGDAAELIGALTSLRIAMPSIVYMTVIDIDIGIQRSEGHCYNLHQSKSGIDFISDHVNHLNPPYLQ